ncbi:MAG: PEP/pyruvate-binding domain-containing protein [Acidimicrobiales bacterium]
MTTDRAIAERPELVSLDDTTAAPSALGAKAANLAAARAAGLPVIDGFVIPPPLAALLASAPRGRQTAEVDLVRRAWASLSRHGSDPVVVRSSSLAEDTASSSQAGVFESVVDVRGWDHFLDAVRAVARSATRQGSDAPASPLAVLVQRHIDPARSGVLFTVDPVSGSTDRMVLAVVEGGPQGLVSGLESGTRLVLDRHAKVLEGPRRADLLAREERRALVRLARRAEALFGGPQDIEWAIEVDGGPVLLQSRPVTAVSARAEGPVFSPGPIAETFPDALQPLEEDLWIAPLRAALRISLELTGSASRRAVDRSPIVVVIDGRPAVDLDLLEGGRARRRGLALLDPRQPARRLRVAWQVGRLRAGLPGLIDDLVAALDRDLAGVPALDTLSDDTLLHLLDRARVSLRAAHGYELLAGTLTSEDGSTGAEHALARLHHGRRAGRSDGEIVASDPIVLALIPPSIGPPAPLPSAEGTRASATDGDPAELAHREALRVRIRWLHELSARAAFILGERLARAGILVGPASVAGLPLESLRRAVRGADVVDADAPRAAGPPLPSRFRLASDGTVVAVRGSAPGGTGASGGRAVGIVAHGLRPPPGSVLVVDTLDPRLAPVLGGLAGLVAATGSPLSHLAILAREHGVPAVVGVDDATRRFPPGTELLVDGTSGEVTMLSRPTGAEATP